MSNNAAKKYTMAELLDLKAQSETLAEFRARRKNLIIATDVLEEGIDVTACNLVICFDPPPNLKSFIQRRGRARQEMSNFAIMFPQNEGASKLKSWRDLEQKLIEAYQNELRQIQDLEAIEDDVEVVPGRLEVRSTG
jgi:ERCC4-related helicase